MRFRKTSDNKLRCASCGPPPSRRGFPRPPRICSGRKKWSGDLRNKGYSKRKRRPRQKPGQAQTAKSLTDILTDVRDLGVKGAGEAMTGLYELFGGSSLKSFPAGFDADTYAKAKPHFEKAYQAFKEAGLGIKKFFEEIRRLFGDAVKPYLRRFMQEKMGVAEELAEKTEEETTTTEEGTEEETEEEAAEETTEEADLTETTGKGERGSRKKLTDAEKAEREAKKKAAEEKKARKAGMGDFQNVGYVYDPENLNKKTKDKSPKSAAKIILDEMIPAKVWKVEFPDGATLGTIRLKDQVQKYFYSFKDYLLASGNRLAYAGRKGLPIEEKIERWMKQGGTIEQFKEWAKKYGETMQPIIDAFKGQTSVTGVIGRLQEVLFSGGGTKYAWPEGGIAQISDTLLHESLKRGGRDFMNYSSRRDLYNLISDTWQNLLADENDVLLSEININQRGRNKMVVRSGLPDYREGVELKKTEDFQRPFGFNGVGFGEEGWINQEERNRVIPAAFDAFKDLAATIGAPDIGMSLGGKLAVQFANLGHKAKGAAAAYFPAVKTINFTRDNGDGTMAHEWGHGFHAPGGSRGRETKLTASSLPFIMFTTSTPGPGW